MGTPVHPRVQTRGHGIADPALVRVLVYARQPTRATWVETELQHLGVMVQIGFSVEHVVSALIEDPPPRPQILVADFDDMEPGEVLHLHVLREHGWFGRIIALGDVPRPLCLALSIERVLKAPFVRDTLRDAIAETSFSTLTTKIPL